MRALARSKGREVFSPTATDRPTVASFFQSYYIPVRLSNSPACTVENYRGTVRMWTLITGDPPLEDITPEMLAKFKSCIERNRAQDGINWASAHTVRKHLRVLQSILDKAGPPGPRNRDAKGILTKIAPWVRPPRADDPEPRFVPLEVISAVYECAVGMDWPWNDRVKPPAWWRALIAVAYNTSLRRRTLFEMRMDEIDWQGRRLNLPPPRLKSRKRLIVPLNDVAYAHLQEIRGNRELVFPKDGSHVKFNHRFYHLQRLAGLKEKDQFGLHDIRRTSATILWEDSPQAAQYALGHSTAEVTKRFYVQGTGLVARARAAMPQPAAFTAAFNTAPQPAPPSRLAESDNHDIYDVADVSPDRKAMHNGD